MRVKCYSSIFHNISQVILKSQNYRFHATPFLSFHNTFTSWDIVGAVCLERKPLITQPLTPLEKRYYQYLIKLEVAKSYLSDHEKRHIEDLKLAEKLKKGDFEDIDQVSKQTAQDFEDACLEHFNKYKPNSRLTEADHKNDQQSVLRKLDSSLLLVVKQKLGNDFRWVLPQTVHQEGETLRQTAERALKDVYPGLKARFLGNAPAGYYKYKYPKAARSDGKCGAKVFFFKAQLFPKQKVPETIEKSETVVDSLWLSHAELKDFLQTDYEKTLQSFLLPDTFDMKFNNLSDLPVSDVDEPVKNLASN